MEFILGTIFGIFISVVAGYYIQYRNNKKIVEEINKAFSTVLRNLDRGHIHFVNRVNQTVVFNTLLPIGRVEIVHFLDKMDVGIYQKGQKLYESKVANQSVIDEICMKLNHRFRGDINNTITIMGNIIDRKTYDKMTGNIKAMSRGMDDDIMGMGMAPKEEDTTPQFDVNDILDKINQFGIESLSKAELEYLNSLGGD